MRARITWIIAGIALTGAAAAWLALRSDPGDSTPTPSRNFPPPDSGVSKTPEREPPPRFTPRDLPVFETPEKRWAEEPRDDRWADTTERELGEKLWAIGEPLGVRFVVGCRTERCAVSVFADTEYALSTVIARMGEPEGLAGVADEMVLGAPEVAVDGSYAMTVYVYVDVARQAD